MAASLHGIRCVIVVPHGNSVEKNRAMIAQGAELLEHGQDFQESLEFARSLATERGLTMVDSFHERLVMGTATYALEFLQSAPALDRVYVPIGLGSSVCGVSAARNALSLTTEIVGVVASGSPSYSLSFSQRKVVEAPARTKIADGLACRTPNAKCHGDHLGKCGAHRESIGCRYCRGYASNLRGHAQCCGGRRGGCAWRGR